MIYKEINYHQAYSFADSVVSVVRHPNSNGFDFDTIPDFFCFRSSAFFNQIQKPQRKTLLHALIYEINYDGYVYYISKVGPDEYMEDYKNLLDAACIPYPAWFNHSQVEKHIDELKCILSKASSIVTEAAFQLLFSDRTFLFEFSQMIAKYIRLLKVGEHPCIISDGNVKREQYFPTWLKNAVFHRDKGHCQLCGKDLTNIFNPTGQRHIDHMVPLKAHGTNDPTNFQLSCESCNKSKGANVLAKKHLSYTYW